jgi:hypothetical protein
MTGNSNSRTVGTRAGNQAKSGGDGASLLVDIDAETGDVLQRVGEVQLQSVFKALDLLVRQDFVDEPLGLLGRGGLKVSSVKLPVNAQDRWDADAKVQVGGVALDDQSEQIVYVHIV